VRRTILFLSIVLLFADTSLRAQQADRTAIQRQIDRFIKAYSSGDTDTLLDIYSSHLVYMPLSVPTVAGPDAQRSNRAFFTGLFAKNHCQLSVKTDEVVVSGRLGFTRGSFVAVVTPKDGSPAKEIHRRFLEVWRKESDGKWRVYRAINTSDGEMHDKH
jgi:uncharacterized protein (TIGR02246 family)